ncbi:hypothetical protein [Rossellomorea sp. SC111]|uniref:hypothetical protein n=1 Tax=Rossellomorea sp. SC111 TaxID=2968985 RepID=UPI00215A18E8|nr:hypothetical protein [Rossellomorea sp. SC111]
MLKNDIKSNKGSSKEYAEIASGSVIITIYVIQIPSEGSRLAERAYNQNLYFWGLIGNDAVFSCDSYQLSSKERFNKSILKSKNPVKHSIA